MCLCVCVRTCDACAYVCTHVCVHVCVLCVYVCVVCARTFACVRVRVSGISEVVGEIVYPFHSSSVHWSGLGVRSRRGPSTKSWREESGAKGVDPTVISGKSVRGETVLHPPTTSQPRGKLPCLVYLVSSRLCLGPFLTPPWDPCSHSLIVR